MKLSRDVAIKLHFLLDELVPPLIRDSRLLMAPLLRIVFGKQAPLVAQYKQKAQRMSHRQMRWAYHKIHPYEMKRETHLNARCVEEILKNAEGPRVLDAGCGNGFLAQRLSERHAVTACDMNIDPALSKKYPGVRFCTANIEQLPFKKDSFDTVVCTHTLEHVQHFFKAVNELRRVARKRLIIVVPCQRPYQYTFDLHLHFFPYPHSLMTLMEPAKNSAVCRNVGGDLVYVEDRKRGVK